MTEYHLLDGLLARAGMVLGLALLLAGPVSRLAGFDAPRGCDRFAAAGAPLLLGAAVLQVLLGTADIATGADDEIELARIPEAALTTTFGRAGARALVFAALVAVVRTGSARLGRAAGPLLGAAVGALGVALALQGHAAIDGALSLHVVLHAAHVVGGAAWLGGVVALAHRLALPSTPPAAVARFAWMAAASMAVVVPTGLLRAAAHVESVADLATDYGHVLAFKVVLVGVLLVFVVRHRSRSLPRLRATEGAVDPVFARDVAAELAIGFATLLAATALTQLAPPV